MSAGRGARSSEGGERRGEARPGDDGRAADVRGVLRIDDRRAARASVLGPRWRATPLALAAWTTLAAIVVAGQVLVPDRQVRTARHGGASSRPGGANGAGAPPGATAVAAAPVSYDALSAPRAPLLAAPPLGPTALGAPAPLLAAPALPPVVPAATAAGPAVAVAAAPRPGATPEASAAAPPERPLLPYLGGEHRFENPLLMPRLREGLRVKLPHLAKLPTVGPLFTRPRPGEPVPVLITAYCLKGTTRRGNVVRTGIVAADPKVFPLARHVELYAGGRFLGRYLVDDTGGKIRGRRIDIWTPDCGDAIRFGARRGVATLVALSEVRRAAQAR